MFSDVKRSLEFYMPETRLRLINNEYYVLEVFTTSNFYYPNEYQSNVPAWLHWFRYKLTGQWLPLDKYVYCQDLPRTEKTRSSVIETNDFEDAVESASVKLEALAESIDKKRSQIRIIKLS